MTREEYIQQNFDAANNLLEHGNEKLSPPKFDCPKCKVGGMCKELSFVLTTCPPQYQYTCNNCGHVDYLLF